MSGLVGLIGARLTELGQTHPEAAVKIGVGQSTFTRWANGSTKPSTRWMTPLAEWLGLPVQEVIVAAHAEPTAPAPSMLAEMSALRASQDQMSATLAHWDDQRARVGQEVREVLRSVTDALQELAAEVHRLSSGRVRMAEQVAELRTLLEQVIGSTPGVGRSRPAAPRSRR